ncbi:DNA helicase II ATP-dependent DNA helicase [Fusarium mexicanum]|uniref:DNA helicase II ATP-dependent DNA helicase n=1 Tax=Fusarium mexicanum TaxID=751941 RepID=A0A8H5N0N9_9HYPO|nr:DNA helicase II ATP-dependent DNA helicase [Fusarium mexicanum]
MSPTITTRLSTSASQAARRYISSSATMKSTAAPNVGKSNSLVEKWRNASPQNRRYVLAGLAVVASVDVYLHYTYWPTIRAWFGGEKIVRN